MTEPTNDLEALARKIAAKALRDRKMPSPSYEAVDVEAGKYDEHSAVQSALAAIIETTEMAAKLVEEALYSTVRVDAVDSPVRWNRRSIAAALRNQEHLR